MRVSHAKCVRVGRSVIVKLNNNDIVIFFPIAALLRAILRISSKNDSLTNAGIYSVSLMASVLYKILACEISDFVSAHCT